MRALRRNSLKAGLILAAGVALCLLEPLPARTCGWSRPNRLLVGGDEGVLWNPLTTFRLEIKRIQPRHPLPFQAKLTPKEPFKDRRPFSMAQYRSDAIRADLEDLAAALTGEGRAPGDVTRLVENYRDARRQLELYSCYQNLGHRGYPQYQQEYIKTQCPELDPSDPPGLLFTLSPELPLEFALYLQGASFYYQRDWYQAREQWQKLLELPPGQRRPKSTWAAFMMGKTLFESQPDPAMEWFRKVRELARQGFPDRLGLAAETYVWEAKYEFDRKNFIRAIELYIAVRAAGYNTGEDELKMAARNIIRGDRKTKRAAARSPEARQVVSAFASSFYSAYDYGAHDESRSNDLPVEWLRAVEISGARDVNSADHLAWTAYQNGRMELSLRWLNRGSNRSGLSLWLRAKLQMRDGNLWEAARLLKLARGRFAEDEGWDGTWVGYACMRWGDWSGWTRNPYPSQLPDRLISSDGPPSGVCALENSTTRPYRRISAELGATQLRLGLFVQALDSFLKASGMDSRAKDHYFNDDEYWLDVVYLAERVLTVEELKDFLDQRPPRLGPPPPPPSGNSGGDIGYEPVDLERLRYVLARRLARLGRWEEARPYYPARLRPRLDAYVDAIRRGSDQNLSVEDRIAAWWEAGDIAKKDGQALLEIEIETDWMRYRNQYEPDKTTRARFGPHRRETFSPTPEEKRRVERHTREAGLSYHYFYQALGHYRAAVALMPNQDAETARRICLAGDWMKYFDPDAADYFYKSLVRRCGLTALGAKADAKRWFPECDVGGK